MSWASVGLAPGALRLRAASSDPTASSRTTSCPSCGGPG
jgi:hypothetical protein